MKNTYKIPDDKDMVVKRWVSFASSWAHLIIPRRKVCEVDENLKSVRVKVEVVMQVILEDAIKCKFMTRKNLMKAKKR